jgi:hypothetical protein
MVLKEAEQVNEYNYEKYEQKRNDSNKAMRTELRSLKSL